MPSGKSKKKKQKGGSEFKICLGGRCIKDIGLSGQKRLQSDARALENPTRGKGGGGGEGGWGEPLAWNWVAQVYYSAPGRPGYACSRRIIGVPGKHAPRGRFSF
jgi:hypothetical protein